MFRRKVLRISFHPVALTGLFPAVYWICGLLLAACSGVQPDYYSPIQAESPEISTDTKLTPEGVRVAIRRVRDLMAQADFLRADGLLKELARKCKDPQQLKEIKQYKERLRKSSFLHHQGSGQNR